MGYKSYYVLCTWLEDPFGGLFFRGVLCIANNLIIFSSTITWLNYPIKPSLVYIKCRHIHYSNISNQQQRIHSTLRVFYNHPVTSPTFFITDQPSQEQHLPCLSFSLSSPAHPLYLDLPLSAVPSNLLYTSS